MVDLQRQSLSRDNPWPGLDPFDETDQAYFYGRAAESSELARLVRRELLTVLFGRSGLGKTSLLKAGLFPLLRKEDFLPVYVRLDHAPGAPRLREQIFRELQTACAAGRVQASQPAEEESLWSFFHRRDTEFWSASNHPVTPVIVFDQFEEIFTLGQEAEAVQPRSAAFLAELGDLVENRPPDVVRRELEADPAAARRFDFKRAAVKLVLSFREDFLAEMEGCKEQMPSLMYNRFRLLAMRGFQAYEVITAAGGALVDDEVARRILRLAWKNEPSPPVDPSDFSNIEIDPALLSVVCSELNHKRQQTQPPLDRITAVLLEGADREILSGFYERGMAGLDPRARTFVEDELITDRGYRDSHALEDALTLPGITAEALDTLIRHRLLRVDERQSVRRLELTHDVLARVVKESRDSRRAREAEEAAKARERAALEQQQRNRRNAALVGTGAFVVIVLAGLAGWFMWKARWAEKRADELLREAESTRVMTNADRLQDTDYAVSLLVNLEGTRVAPTLDAQAGLLRRFMSHPHLATFLPTYHVVAFSPDGRLLASQGDDYVVVLWDVASHKRLETLRGHKDLINSIAFSPDGKLLASGSDDKTVILWDIARRERSAILEEHSQVISVAFSPDGKWLASGLEKTLSLWEMASHQRLATLEGHKSFVNTVAFSPAKKLLASASADKTIILWDVASRKQLVTLRGHKANVMGLAFSPDGKLLASASLDKTIVLWNMANRKLEAVLEGYKDSMYRIAFSPNGKWLASGGLDKSVILWDVASREVLATLNGHKAPVYEVAFSPDGKLLASADAARAVILWDLANCKLQKRIEGMEDKIWGLAVSPNGKLLALASRDLSLWDVDRRRLLAQLKGHKDEVLGTAFSPDGKLLASGSRDKTVTVWDVDSRKLLTVLQGHQGEVQAVAFSPDSKLLASAGDHVVLWDVGSHKVLATLEGHNREIQTVSFSPDGTLLASASDHIVLTNVGSRKVLATLENKRDIIYSVAFSPDGKLLASADSHGAVVLWDVIHRKPVATLEGHKGIVLSVVFSVDGKMLASASGDKTIILWDVASYLALTTLEGHNDKVWGLAFSPDGKRLFSASRDKTSILWDLGLDHLKSEACRTANRNLTCDEWRDYIGADKPYHKTCPTLPGPETCD